VSKKRIIIKRKSTRDVKTQVQVSKVVEVLGGVGERNPRRREEVEVHRRGSYPWVRGRKTRWTSSVRAMERGVM
jgi:hypothetical protein